MELNNLDPKIKQFFIDKGFSEEEIAKQMTILGEIINLTILQKLLSQKLPVKKLNSEDEVEKYIKENFTKEEVQAIFISEGERLTKEYLATME